MNKLLKSCLKKHLKEIDTHFSKSGWKLNYSILKDEFLYSLLGEEYLTASNEFFMTVIKKYPINMIDSNSSLFVFKNQKEYENAVQGTKISERVRTARDKKPKAVRPRKTSR